QNGRRSTPECHKRPDRQRDRHHRGHRQRRPHRRLEGGHSPASRADTLQESANGFVTTIHMSQSATPDDTLPSFAGPPPAGPSPLETLHGHLRQIVRRATTPSTANASIIAASAYCQKCCEDSRP